MIIPGQLRALVVDDNAYARAISAQNFRKLGVGEIVEASGGAEAILLLMKQKFDLMLMDWYMPDISGAGIMQVLRDERFGAARNLPVILMTAYANRDNVVRARQLGVNEVITKPFSPEQLGMAMNRVLGSIRAPAQEDAVFI